MQGVTFAAVRHVRSVLKPLQSLAGRCEAMALTEVQLHSVLTCCFPTEVLLRHVHGYLTLLARSSILPVAPEVSSDPPAASTSFCKVWGSGLRSRAPESNSQLSCSLPPPDAAPITYNTMNLFFSYILNLSPFKRFKTGCLHNYVTKQ